MVRGLSSDDRPETELLAKLDGMRPPTEEIPGAQEHPNMDLRWVNCRIILPMFGAGANYAQILDDFFNLRVKGGVKSPWMKSKRGLAPRKSLAWPV
jgi:hypothetical protein